MNAKLLDPELLSLYPKESDPTTRRDFLITTLGAGFALAVQPSLAATAITTSTQDLDTGEAKIPVADGTLPAYFAKPDTKPATGAFPVMLVVQEIFGVHEYIKDVCRRLARQGYLAIAPELYARVGDPAKIADIQTILSQIVSKVPDSQVLSDLDACVAWAGQNGGDANRLGITGFCWGGRIVWLYAAHNPKLKAGVAWYGKLVGDKTANNPKQPLEIAGQLNAPVLGLYAGEDTGISAESIAEMQKKLSSADNPASKASSIHVYPGVPHAFHADYRPSYREAEAKDGWKRLIDWFKQHELQ